jgi:hypothetical protein
LTRVNQQNKEQSTPPTKVEKQLLSIRDERQKMIRPNCHPTYNERQKMIRPNCHPTYNERHEKIIELIDWTLEKYKANMENAQPNGEQVIIDDIIKQLDKQRNIDIQKMKKAMLKDEVSMYRLQETTLDYVLFRIRELTGKLY